MNVYLSTTAGLNIEVTTHRHEWDDKNLNSNSLALTKTETKAIYTFLPQILRFPIFPNRPLL